MDDILGMFAEILWDLLGAFKFKNPNTVRWVKTVFMGIFCAGLSGYCIYSSWDIFLTGSITGKIAMGTVDAALVIGSVAAVTVGHKKNWHKW